MQEKNNKNFSEFLSILYKWKKFLIINLILISLFTIVITLLINNKYKATSTVIISSSSSNVPISSMLSDVSSLLGIGTGNAGNVEYLLGILGSRELKLALIDKFELLDYYDFSKYKIDRTLKELENDYFYELNENGMIDISFVHEDPKISSEIVNFITEFADSVNLKIHFEKAKSYRQFIERRYNKCQLDLNSAEKDLQNFQTKTGLYVIPDQLMLNLGNIIELEKKLYMMKLELEVYKSDISPNTTVINQLENQIKIYTQSINSIKNGKDKSKLTSFLPMNKLPKIYREYVEVYRNFELQNRILETLTPLYEQALMDEQKDIPSIIVLDPPLIPELKYSPKRANIVIIVFLLSLFLLIPITLLGENSLEKKSENVIEEKLFMLFSRVKKIYFLKF